MATTNRTLISRLGRIACGTLAALLLAATPAFAITAGEVLDKMTRDERFGYITGAIDMAMYHASTLEKNNPKAECILNWYYGKDAPGPKQVLNMFDRNRERNAIALIQVLINRACPAKS